MRLSQIKVAVLMLALTAATLTACTKKEEQTTTETTTTAEAPAEAPTETVASDTPSGGNSIDQTLDEYEKMVDEYKAIMDKIKKGDNSAVSEMQELSKKISDINNKIAKPGDGAKMTPEQEARIKKIADMYTQATQ